MLLARTQGRFLPPNITPSLLWDLQTSPFPLIPSPLFLLLPIPYYTCMVSVTSIRTDCMGSVLYLTRVIMEVVLTAMVSLWTVSISLQTTIVWEFVDVNTARFRKDETRNGHRDGNQNRWMAKELLFSFQMSRLKRELTITDSDFHSNDYFGSHL